LFPAKKAADCAPVASENLWVQDATTVAAGAVVSTLKTGTGLAKVYRQKKGRYVRAWKT
jgi:hypothetical protein